jgi:hypothetical protein
LGDEGVFRGQFELNRSDYNLEKKRIGEVIAVGLVVPVIKTQITAFLLLFFCLSPAILLP